MNLSASYRYQMADHKKAIIIFYVVVIGLSLIFGFSGRLLINGTDLTASGSVNGSEMTTVIFLFVIGLCTFKETFLMSVQNGISRKSIFTAKILTMLSVAAIMSLLDRLLSLLLMAGISITKANINTETLYESLYPASTSGASLPLVQLESFLFECVLALAAMAVGYFITIMFYRVAKTGKILIGAGVPILCFMVIPLLDQNFFNSRITMAIAHFLRIVACTPVRMAVFGLFIFALFSGFSFLLMRKAIVKR